MSRQRFTTLFVVLALLVVAAVGGWVAGKRITSPAEAAARTAAPTPSPILVPVERRVLSSDIVTRGTGRFGLPQAVSIAPSTVKGNAGLITTLPLRNKQLDDGQVLLTASGRPVFVLAGEIPAYRDLVPGIAGDDVRQLKQGLKRLGFDPGDVDGTYDDQTSAAVAKWYQSAGWEPFGPTPAQRAKIRTLEQDLGDAMKRQLAAEGVASSAKLVTESARAQADHAQQAAATDLAAKMSDRQRLIARSKNGTPLAVESARAQVQFANQAASADIAAKIAGRAVIVLDPLSTRASRAAADANLRLARAAAVKIRLEGDLAVRAAEREATLAAGQLELAQSAVKAAQLQGQRIVQEALDAQKIAELDAKLVKIRTDRIRADLETAQRKVGVQVPVDEIVFLPSLPVRVEEITARVGDAASGPVLTVTDNQLAIDAALPLDAAPLVKSGMTVTIDEQALGIQAKGIVQQVANTPGTRGVDGYHFYCEIRVLETSVPLQGFSLRLTIPIESTEGKVTAVPMSALSLAADGTSRVQISHDGDLEYVVVEPGLSADGFVQVSPVGGTLEPGQLVVVGFEKYDAASATP